MIQLTIDGRTTHAPEGTTILQACNAQGIDTPTLCHLKTLTPVNACRLCVVELEGARTLAPACSRKVEAGMVVRTNTDRVRHSRKLILELLGSSVDLSLASSDIKRHMREYGAAPERLTGETVAQPVKVDNDLYVRDYSKCVLCYKCVEACGTDAQNTFAIAVAGRGFDAHISTESDRPLTDSACTRNCSVCDKPVGVVSRPVHSAASAAIAAVATTAGLRATASAMRCHTPLSVRGFAPTCGMNGQNNRLPKSPRSGGRTSST